MPSPAKISLCMIAKNEEDWIADAIASVKDLVSEIILVDTGSTDTTIEIAEGFGAKIIRTFWENDFAKARNFSIDNASGDWILVLDADERIDEKDHGTILKLTENPANGYRLNQRHYRNNITSSGFVSVKGEYEKWEMNYRGYSENPLCRLFPRREDLRFVGKVHELMEPAVVAAPDLNLVDIKIPIHHYGQSEEVLKNKKKLDFYLQLGRQKAAEEGSWKAWYELAMACMGAEVWRESADAFAKCTVLWENYPKQYNMYGIVLCKLGETDKAIDVFSKGLTLDISDPEMHFNLGVCYMNLKNYIFAEAHLKKCLKLKPGYLHAYHTLGKLLINSHQTASAINILSEALALYPDSPESKKLLRYAYVRTGMKEHAAKIS